MKKKTFSEIRVGESAELKRTINEADIEKFAELSGDYNPIHMNEEFARTTIFKSRIAHGILTAAFISAVLARDLPGPGSILLSQKLIFKKPVRIGDTITARVEVSNKDKEKERISLRTTCTNQNNELVVDGEALTMPMKD
ncbi:MAG: MaoC family dehydratase [Candidatus Heimdallarchaeota archaeon]